MEKRKIIVERKLCVSDSIIASIPFFISAIFYLLIAFLGLIVIKSEFQDNSMYPLLIMMWILVLFNLTRIVISPVTTWSVEEEVSPKA